jgi:hypothetical protein
LEKVYEGIMEVVNELQLQIASRKTLSAIDYHTINTNIDKVQAQNVVFWLLDDIRAPLGARAYP